MNTERARRGGEGGWTRPNGPGFTGFHHVAPAVRDLGASAAWYERVLGLTWTSTPCPENDGDVPLVLVHVAG